MRIFISHGTDKTKRRELAFLDVLEARLTKGPPAHDVLLDRTRIGAGDDWQGILNDVLAECQAAVLLLSPRALERPWVLKEATLLSFRKEQDAQFPFFCVLLPGVTTERIRALPAFAALRLDRIQAFATGTSAGKVADWVLAHAATLNPPSATPLDRLERVLEARLVNVHAEELERLCEALIGEPVAWTGSAGRTRQHARMLARCIVRGASARVDGLSGLARALDAAGLGKDHLRRVIDLASSMWVDAEVAGRLAAVMAQPADTEPFAAALNGARFNWSPRVVAWRAQMPDVSDFVFHIDGGWSDDAEGDLVRKIRKAYRSRGDEDDIDSDEQVDDVLRLRRTPIVYVLPPPVPDAALLRALRKRYPRVTFIVHTGKVLPSAAELPAAVVPLSPGLDLELEALHHADHASAIREIR